MNGFYTNMLFDYNSSHNSNRRVLWVILYKVELSSERGNYIIFTFRLASFQKGTDLLSRNINHVVLGKFKSMQK